MTSQAPTTKVSFTTPYGTIVVRVETEKAPITSANFLAYVDQGLFKDTTVYRIVTNDNQPNDTVKIEVIQFGYEPVAPAYPTPLPAIPHEPTTITGLKHLDGTISMARATPGTASSGFFICVGDQPELDFGGKRQPDGQGFAAFGQVIEGMDVVRTLLSKGEANQMIASPIPILSVARVLALPACPIATVRSSGRRLL